MKFFTPIALFISGSFLCSMSVADNYTPSLPPDLARDIARVLGGNLSVGPCFHFGLGDCGFHQTLFVAVHDDNADSAAVNTEGGPYDGLAVCQGDISQDPKFNARNAPIAVYLSTGVHKYKMTCHQLSAINSPAENINLYRGSSNNPTGGLYIGTINQGTAPGVGIYENINTLNENSAGLTPDPSVPPYLKGNFSVACAEDRDSGWNNSQHMTCLFTGHDLNLPGLK